LKKPAEHTGRIARTAGTVGIAVMFSRVFGLVREQVFAYFFGAGFAYDAFVVAFRIPNLLRDLFAEGALSSAFVTVFSDYETNRSREECWRLVGNVMVFFTILLTIITLLGMWQAENIVRLMVEAKYELTPGKVELTRQLTIIMFPFLILVSQAAVCMGILNTRGYFFVPAMSSTYFNVGSIVTGVGLAAVLPRFGIQPIVAMAIGTLVGGVLQLVVQFPALVRAGFLFRPNLSLSDPGLRRVMRLMVPAVAGLAALQVNVFINNFFASSLQEGSLSWLSYAFRLFMFPVGVFGVAISIAAHPVMARQAAAGSMSGLKESYVSTLVVALCLTIPASIGLIMLADPLIRIIFEHGRFDHHSTLMTSSALAYYAVGLAAYAGVKVTVPVFYNIDNTKVPVLGSALAMVINVAVILLCIDALQHRALALSISCAMAGNFLLLFAVLHRKLAGLPLRYLGTALGKVLAAALVMGVWLWGLGAILWAEGMHMGPLVEIPVFLLTVGSGGLVYGLVLYWLRLPELRLVVDRLRERFGRRANGQLDQ
jgi:putative peptidoglycan lipid II flippase